MSRAVIPLADGDNDGEFTAANAVNPLAVRLSLAPEPNALFDDFGRLRVSMPHTIWDGSFVATNNGLLRWHAQTAGNGAVNTTSQPYATLTATGAAGTNNAVLQNRRIITYQPGKAATVYISGALSTTAPTAPGTLIYFGYARSPVGSPIPNSGIVFLRQNTGVSLVIVRTSGISIVPQASWNRDPMDGTGPSGITIDFNLRQIYFITFKWLGSGDVTAGFVVGQRAYPAHTFTHTNALSAIPYWPAGSQRIFAAVSVAAAEGPLQMNVACASVTSEGGYNSVGNTFCADLPTAVSPAIGTRTMIFALRVAPSNIFTTVHVLRIEASTTIVASALVRINIRHLLSPASEGNPAGVVDSIAAGAGWTAVGVSQAQFSSQVTANPVSNGANDRLVAQTYARRNVDAVLEPHNLNLSVDPAGLSDILYITATADAGTANLNINVMFEEFN